MERHDPDGSADVVAALAAVAAGDRDRALRRARAAAAADPTRRLAAALAEHLERGPTDAVYDAPAAFAAFTSGGGNLALYRATSAALAEQHRLHHVTALADVGCGDGRALVPALAAHGSPVRHVTLVEPAAALLQRCVGALAALRAELGPLGRSLSWTTAGTGALEALPDLPPHLDLVQLTFAASALGPAVRPRVLAGLRQRTRHLVIAEFDVPPLAPRSPAAVAHLAERYEEGLAEYEGPLVAQGFLLPVLVDQLDPARTPVTWEQPASAWVAELHAAGFGTVEVTPLAPYWWAPAVLLHAC